MNSKRLLLICLILLLIGISLFKGAEIVGTTPRENVLTITPLELFSGIEEKYKSLIPYTHGVKFNYIGDERDIIIDATIWDNGEQVGELCTIIGKLSSDSEHINLDQSELLFALEKVNLDALSAPLYQLTFATVEHNGNYASYQSSYMEDEGLEPVQGFSFTNIGSEIKLRPGERQNIIAYQANRKKASFTTIDINNVDQFKPYWLIIVSFELSE